MDTAPPRPRSERRCVCADACLRTRHPRWLAAGCVRTETTNCAFHLFLSLFSQIGCLFAFPRGRLSALMLRGWRSAPPRPPPAQNNTFFASAAVLANFSFLSFSAPNPFARLSSSVSASGWGMGREWPDTGAHTLLSVCAAATGGVGFVIILFSRPRELPSVRATRFAPRAPFQMPRGLRGAQRAARRRRLGVRLGGR